MSQTVGPPLGSAPVATAAGAVPAATKATETATRSFKKKMARELGKRTPIIGGLVFDVLPNLWEAHTRTREAVVMPDGTIRRNTRREVHGTIAGGLLRGIGELAIFSTPFGIPYGAYILGAAAYAGVGEARNMNRTAMRQWRMQDYSRFYSERSMTNLSQSVGKMMDTQSFVGNEARHIAARGA